jgi:hypothetical protein
MAKLIYVTPTSLNGHIADETGDFDWAAPDEEVHAFINDVVRPIDTCRGSRPEGSLASRCGGG